MPKQLCAIAYALLFAGTMFGFCLVAHAESSVLLLPPASEPGVAPSTLERATAELERALRDKGFSVRAARPNELRTTSADPNCYDNACGLASLSAAQTTYAARLHLFHYPQGESLAVTILERPQAVYAADAEFQPANLAEHIQSVVHELAQQLQKGAGPWLSVSGKPVGAGVRLDGKVLGAIPLTRRVGPGEHVLIVEHPGFEPFNTTLDVSELAGTHKTVAVELKPSVEAVRNGPTPSAKTNTSRARSPKLWVGLTAASAGTVLTAFAARALRRDGECAADECTQVQDDRYEPRLNRSANFAVLAGGLGLFATGITLSVVGLTERVAVSASTNPHSASLILHGGF